jgi:hypothetical protein
VGDVEEVEYAAGSWYVQQQNAVVLKHPAAKELFINAKVLKTLETSHMYFPLSCCELPLFLFSPLVFLRVCYNRFGDG